MRTSMAGSVPPVARCLRAAGSPDTFIAVASNDLSLPAHLSMPLSTPLVPFAEDVRCRWSWGTESASPRLSLSASLGRALLPPAQRLRGGVSGRPLLVRREPCGPGFKDSPTSPSHADHWLEEPFLSSRDPWAHEAKACGQGARVRSTLMPLGSPGRLPRGGDTRLKDRVMWGQPAEAGGSRVWSCGPSRGTGVGEALQEPLGVGSSGRHQNVDSPRR